MASGSASRSARSPCTSSAASPRSRASRRTPKQEFAISAVGPVTSLALGGRRLRAAGSVMPDGLLQFVVGGAGRGQPLVGVLNLVPGHAARRRPGAARGRLEDHRRPAPGHLVAGWAGRGRRGAHAGLAPCSCEAARLTADVDRLRHRRRASAGSSGRPRRAAIVSAPVRRRLPGAPGPAAGPPHPRGARGPAARRGGPPGPGVAGRLDRHPGPARPAGRAGQRGRGRSPPRRTAAPWVPVSAVARTLEPGLVAARRHRGRGADPGDAGDAGRRSTSSSSPTARSRRARTADVDRGVRSDRARSLTTAADRSLDCAACRRPRRTSTTTPRLVRGAPRAAAAPASGCG